MKQRKEPMELPLLEIVFLPGDPIPVVISLPGDFELTGDVVVGTLTATHHLEEIQRYLIIITNHVADVIWERRKNEPPFIPTGRLSPDGEEPSE